MPLQNQKLVDEIIEIFEKRCIDCFIGGSANLRNLEIALDDWLHQHFFGGGA